MGYLKFKTDKLDKEEAADLAFFSVLIVVSLSAIGWAIINL